MLFGHLLNKINLRSECIISEKVVCGILFLNTSSLYCNNSRHVLSLKIIKFISESRKRLSDSES